jgi:hypothetical protein
VLCEKSLWWPPNAQDRSDYPPERIRKISSELADQATVNDYLLALNTECSCTLETFPLLHHRALARRGEPSRFEVWLSPTQRGAATQFCRVPRYLGRASHWRWNW